MGGWVGGCVQEGGGGKEWMGVAIRWDETGREGTKFKRKGTKIRNETLFREKTRNTVSRNNSKRFFRIFFRFAKRSKPGETVTNFIFCET